MEMRPEGWVGPDMHGSWVMVGGFVFVLRTVDSFWSFLKRRSWETDSNVEEKQSVCRYQLIRGISRLEVLVAWTKVGVKMDREIERFQKHLAAK